MNKTMKIALIIIGVFVTISILGAVLKICPPQGPWPQPPGCGGSNATKDIRTPSLPSPKNEDNKYITKYLPSDVPVYGRIAFDNIEDLPFSPTIIAWGAHIPATTVNTLWINHEKSKGVKHISVISVWNNDRWKKVDDLPEELKTAYVTDFDGNPLYIQEDVFLNFLDPALQEWIKKEMRAHIDAGTDGFAFDEYTGTSQATYPGNGPGPFDNYSLKGFNDFLENKYTGDELKKLGVNDITGFNYKEYLIKNNYRERYANGYWDNPAPFQRDYNEYLSLEANKVIKELIQYADSYAKQKGKTLIFSANDNPLYQSKYFDFDKLLNVYTFEHEWFPRWRKEKNAEYSGGVPSTPVIKYARSLGKDAAIMPGIYDLTMFQNPAGSIIFNHELAETYASGGYYMYFPHIDYIGIKFSANRSLNYDYMNFVRAHPEAFNNLSYTSNVAVLMPSIILANEFEGPDHTVGYSVMLSEANIPHDVTGIDKIQDYKIVFATGFTWTDSDVQKLLDYIKSGGIVIANDNRFASKNENNKEVDRPALENLKKDGTNVYGAGKLIFNYEDYGYKIYLNQDTAYVSRLLSEVKKVVQPNVAPAKVKVLPYVGDDGRIVIHVLNYDFNGYDFNKKTSLGIQINLPEGANVSGKSLTLLSPDFKGNQTLNFMQEQSKITFTLPELYIWDVVIIK